VRQRARRVAARGRLVPLEVVMKINILLADGRKLLREALSLLLEKQDDFRVVGEAEDSQDVK
jgi:hypothetical protein